MNQTIQTILKRRSTRSYKAEQITNDELDALIHAALYAPFAGDYLIHVVAVQSKDILKDINDTAKKAACEMPLPHLKQLGSDESFVCYYDAPTLFFLCADESAIAGMYDCAAAAQNVLVAAESLDLGACWVHFPIFAFAAENDLIKKLDIPAGYKPMASVAVGYKSEGIEYGDKKVGTYSIIQ